MGTFQTINNNKSWRKKANCAHNNKKHCRMMASGSLLNTIGRRRSRPWQCLEFIPNIFKNANQGDMWGNEVCGNMPVPLPSHSLRLSCASKHQTFLRNIMVRSEMAFMRWEIIPCMWPEAQSSVTPCRMQTSFSTTSLATLHMVHFTHYLNNSASNRSIVPSQTLPINVVKRIISAWDILPGHNKQSIVAGR